MCPHHRDTTAARRYSGSSKEQHEHHTESEHTPAPNKSSEEIRKHIQHDFLVDKNILQTSNILYSDYILRCYASAEYDMCLLGKGVGISGRRASAQHLSTTRKGPRRVKEIASKGEIGGIQKEKLVLEQQRQHCDIGRCQHDLEQATSSCLRGLVQVANECKRYVEALLGRRRVLRRPEA